MPLNPTIRNLAAKLTKANRHATDEDIVSGLVAFIREPDQVDDTNAFASLVADIGDKRFIDPLISRIAEGIPSETLWLADYMYALVELLDRCDGYYPVHEDFVNLLGDWLLRTGGGEISWKAGEILSEVECYATKEYLLKGAADESLFHLTRIACLRGIVNQFSQEARPLLRSLEGDRSQEVREACQSALIHLDHMENRT